MGAKIRIAGTRSVHAVHYALLIYLMTVVLRGLAARPQDASESAYYTTRPFLLSYDYLVTGLLNSFILAWTDYTALITSL